MCCCLYIFVASFTFTTIDAVKSVAMKCGSFVDGLFNLSIDKIENRLAISLNHWITNHALRLRHYGLYCTIIGTLSVSWSIIQPIHNSIGTYIHTTHALSPKG
jgi:hypothetical protein